jgi:hypothetical protein
LPDITIGAGANALLLNWASSGVGYALYTTTNLTPPVIWSPTTNQITFSNNQWQATVTPGSDAARFYRLESQ